MHLFRVGISILSFALLGFMIFMAVGILSAIGTQFNVELKANYECGVEEVLSVKFNKAKGQITYFGYDEHGDLYDVRQFNGWFLKWGNYYVFPSRVTYSPLSPPYFDIKAYYIQEVSLGKYVLLSHQRSIHVTNNKEVFPLRGGFIGEISRLPL